MVSVKAMQVKAFEILEIFHQRRRFKPANAKRLPKVKPIRIGKLCRLDTSRGFQHFFQLPTSLKVNTQMFC
jgi:hypothetical protein